MKKILSLVVIFSIVAGLCSGCAKKSEKIVVATQFEITNGVLFVMEDKEIFQKYLPSQTQVEYIPITGGGSAVREALQSGSAQFASLGSPPIVSCWDQDSPLSILSGLAAYNYYVYSNSPDIQSLSDIGQDDKIAVLSIGGAYNILFSMCAEALFGDPQKFEGNLQVMPHAEALTAMQSGQIQAWVTAPPYTGMLDGMENMHQILDIMETVKFQWGTNTVALKSYADSNPKICEAFRKAVEESMQFIKDNPDESAAIIARNMGATVEDTRNDMEDLEYESTVFGYDEIASFMYRAGLIQNEPKLLKDILVG